MRTAYFDCQFGAAGDMLLGSLFAAGVPFDKWLSELEKLRLPSGSFKVSVADIVRGGIASKKVDVYFDGHDHDDEHIHNHEHTNNQPHEHRRFSDIVHMLEHAKITDRARDLSIAIFENLAEAEAKVHGVSKEEVHFHEVGAIDAIVDVVGFSIAYDMLGIERSIVSALPLGSGTIKMQHGVFPVPGPAVVYLLQKATTPIHSQQFDFECLTPTGAAILVTIARAWQQVPAWVSIEAVGYGAGSTECFDHPNVCRVMIGQQSDSGSELASGFPPGSAAESHSEDSLGSLTIDQICVLEANLDDCSPQVLAFASEELLKQGALDVAILPAQMKKGRPGHLLSVLCHPADKRRLQEIILRETTTLGVRSYNAERLITERRWDTVSIRDGDEVRIKVGLDRQGNVLKAHPEYDDCVACATKHGVALKEIISEAMDSYTESNLDAYVR